MDFRHLHRESVRFLQHNRALLVDMQKGRIKTAREFKRRYPGRLVLMQVNDEWNGIWGSWHVVPREYARKEGLRHDTDIWPSPEFRGFWLLGPAADVSSDFPASSREVTISVPSPEHFVASIYGRRKTRDVLIYPVREGEPVWRGAEYASVAEVNAESGTIRLRRWPRDAVGEWHSFSAGRARVAPSPGSVYPSKQHDTWIRTWIPNLTRYCPRNPETNRNAVQWWARHFARLWNEHIAASEPHPDGLEFDGLQATPLSDCNRDGKPDGGVIDGINYWRAGQRQFFRKLRKGDSFEGMGEDLVVSDCNSPRSRHAPGLLNGYESEEYPGFAGDEELPQALDMYLLWCRRAQEPVCNYLQGRFQGGTYYEGPWRKALQRGHFMGDNVARVGIASACLGTGFYTYRTNGDRDKAGIFKGRLVEFPWGEYYAGRAGEYGWLGLPEGPARRLTTHLGPDLLADTERAWESRVSGDRISLSDWTPSEQGVGVRVHINGQGRPRRSAATAELLAPPVKSPLDGSTEYTVAFRVSGVLASEDTRFPNVPRPVTVSLGQGKTDRQTVLAANEPRRASVTVLSPGAGGRLRPRFGIGNSPGPVHIEDVEVRRGCAEVYIRRFEHGLVLLNGSRRQPYTFNVKALGGEQNYTRFDGQQDPAVNSGKPVRGSVTVPAMDALLLRTRSDSS
jgi:hypothetical protein